MNQVQRIYHLRVREYDGQPPKAHGGATVIVTGVVGYNQVSVRTSFCNKTDTFCKARGRSFAQESQEKIIPLRKLPGELGGIWKEVMKRNKTRWEGFDRPRFDNRVFDFLPKELV